MSGYLLWLILWVIGHLHVEVEFGGDLALGRSIGRKILKTPERGQAFFAPLRRHLASADLAVANLEGAVRPTGSRERAPGVYDLSFGEECLGLLSQTGFHALSLANNHSRDGGRLGETRTIEGLISQGIKPLCGVSTIRVKGATIRVLAVDFTSGRMPRDGWPAAEADWRYAVALESERRRLVTRVSSLVQEDGSPLFIFFHGGVEDSELVSPSETELFEDLLKTGVAGIFGHHAHRMKPGGALLGKPCFPGLGSVLFDRSRAPDCYGAMVRVTVWGGLVAGWQVFPLHIRARSHQPVIWPETWMEREPWSRLFQVVPATTFAGGSSGRPR